MNFPLSGAECPFGYGVFCNAKNAEITDLIVENFEFRQMPKHSGNFSGQRGNGDTGGLIGRASGNTNCLNCHTSGIINSNLGYPAHNGMGGIIGTDAENSAQSMYFYRCSTEVEITIVNGNLNCHMGGMLGDSSNGGDVTIYDCVANITYAVSNAWNSAASASVACFESSGRTIRLENFVYNAKGSCTLKENSGPLLGYYTGVSIQSLKNCYGLGMYGNTGTEYVLHAVCGPGSALSVNGSSISNINLVKPASLSYYNNYTSENK